MESVSVSNGRASVFDIVVVDGYSFLPHLLFPCFNLQLLSSICLFDFADSLEFFVACAFYISIAAKKLMSRTCWGGRLRQRSAIGEWLVPFIGGFEGRREYIPNGVHFMTRIHRTGNAIDAKHTRINIKSLIERLGLSDVDLQQFQDGGSNEEIEGTGR